MADTLAENLENDIARRESQNAPCTFKRTNKIPIDSKSCFKTYQQLEAYINGEESTAYPGQFVAVTSNQDEKQGGYILTATEDDKLVPVSLAGGIKSITIEGEDGSKIDAVVDGTGHATLVIDEIEFDELRANSLFVNGFDVGQFFTMLQQIEQMDEVESGDYTVLDLKNKFNHLLQLIKDAYTSSQVPLTDPEQPYFTNEQEGN